MKKQLCCIMIVVAFSCSKEKKQFKESPAIAVFTSSFVLDGHDIVFVSHDADDGAWQFYSKDSLHEKDAKVVSLKEIIRIDPTLLELVDMKAGFYAERANKNEEWVIQKNRE